MPSRSAAMPLDAREVREASASPSDGQHADGQGRSEVRGRAARTPEVALTEAAAERLECAQLLGCLDALGDALDAERVREVDDAAHDRGVVGVDAETGDEGAVHLEQVDGEALEVQQR